MSVSNNQQQQRYQIPTQGAGGGGTLATSSGGGNQIPNKMNAPPNRPVRWTFTLILAATAVPQMVPGYRVPPNCSVWLYAKNGAAAGNAKPLFVGSYREELANSGGTALMPNDEMPWPAENTAALWIQGQAADGIIVQVISNPTAS